jgi:hypothetical protein
MRRCHAASDVHACSPSLRASGGSTGLPLFAPTGNVDADASPGDAATATQRPFEGRLNEYRASRADLLLAIGACATRGPRLGFTSARSSEAWCGAWLCPREGVSSAAAPVCGTALLRRSISEQRRLDDTRGVAHQHEYATPQALLPQDQWLSVLVPRMSAFGE